MSKKKGIADIVFVIDASGSMADCIDGLKNNIGDFIDSLEGSGPNNHAPLKDWRGKIVGYRDFNADDDEWFVDNSFVSSAAELKNQLSSLNAQGGGDEPESLLDALHKVVSQPTQDKGHQSTDPSMWRHRHDATRVIAVFTDATFHETMSYEGGAGGTVNDVRDLLMSNRITLSLFAPATVGYEELSMTDKCEWEAIEEPFVENLAAMSKDSDGFKKLLIALAKTVSVTSFTETEVL